MSRLLRSRELSLETAKSVFLGTNLNTVDHKVIVAIYIYEEYCKLFILLFAVAS